MIGRKADLLGAIIASGGYNSDIVRGGIVYGAGYSAMPACHNKRQIDHLTVVVNRFHNRPGYVVAVSGTINVQHSISDDYRIWRGQMRDTRHKSSMSTI